MDVFRQCIACRQLHPRNRMIRVTCARLKGEDAGTEPGFQFSVDNRPPLQGRSAYVCRSAACLGEALKGKKFQRTLKRAIPDDILRSLNLELKGLSSEWPPQK